MSKGRDEIMSKQIPLTQGQVAIVDDSDFEWLSRWKWHTCRRKTPNGKIYYAGRWTSRKLGKPKLILMHRQILNATPQTLVDHKNSNGLDNQRMNLRECTSLENARNCQKHKGASKYKGVCWHKHFGKWMVQIRVNRKKIYLGYFKDEVEAAQAYDKKAKELFGSFAKLNFAEAI